MDRSDSWILVDEVDLTTEVPAPDVPAFPKDAPAAAYEVPADGAVDVHPSFAVDAAPTFEVPELEELEAIEASTPMSVKALPVKPPKSSGRPAPFLPFVMLIVGLGLIRLAVEALVRE